MPRQDYEQRQIARQERLERAAERAKKRADAAYKRADLREEVSGIPLGQPILVGHHSEKRHRRAIERADNAMRRSIEEGKKASEYAARAASVGESGISSDDPTAVEQLKAKADELERRQNFMRAANRVVRKFHKAGARNADGTTLWVSYLNALRDLPNGEGFSEQSAVALLVPDFAGRIGFADYQLTNNNANLKRTRDRIAQLEREAQREHVEVETNHGFKIVQNVEENRIQLLFDGKPSFEIRKILKSNGFRWAPSVGAWQRMLNNAGIYAARRARDEIANIATS